MVLIKSMNYSGMIIKSNLFIFHPYNQIEITTFFWTLHIGVSFLFTRR